jgi:acyl-CoA thioester hydrolase
MPRHELVIPLRWGDFDALGHVNNVRYFEFMQDSRIALVHEFGLPKSSLTEIGHLVARNEIDYLRPIDMNDHAVRVSIWVSRFGGASYDVQYEIFDDAGDLCARAKSVMVTVDMRTEAVIRVPDDVRAAMSRFFEE